MPDTVAPIITDSVARAQVVGNTPARALGQLYETAAASLGVAFQNSVYAQNNGYAVLNAAITESANLLLTDSRVTSNAANPSAPAKRDA